MRLTACGDIEVIPVTFFCPFAATVTPSI